MKAKFLHGLKRGVAVGLMAAQAITLFPVATNTNFLTQNVLAATNKQVEALDRGLVAMKVSGGVFLSWRLLGTDDYSTAFNVYRNGVKIAGPITNSTNYTDSSGSASNNYYVRAVVNGKETTQSDSVSVWSNNYIDIPLDKPSNTTLNGTSVTYSANDASVADVDGDGQYEIILKWDPSNAQDNSKSGYTSNVYVDCYELDGTKRWRIDLGKNIRAGAHYTQFIAYDLNGDGKAEVAMKTSDGTVAGDGTVIGNASADYRNSSGYILTGNEYLTLFEGRTGKILDNIDFTPARGTVSSWGDNYGNRVDRFLAGVAYLDGKTPSLIMTRGYYTRSVVSAYKYKGGTLNKQWTYDSGSSAPSDATKSAYGQGAHSLSVGDVDNDGYDEIVFGSAVIDHNGKLLNSTGHGHGDALHVSDFNNDGNQEIFMVHEDKAYYTTWGAELRRGSDAKILAKVSASSDVGRGVMANISDTNPGAEFWSTANSTLYNASGKSIGSRPSQTNFVTYWDGDLCRELLDSTYINKYNGSTGAVTRVTTFSNVHSNNSTKSTPSLSADIFGDWREEVMFPTSDDKYLRIYTTDIQTNNKLYTLMHDTAYRCQVAGENVAYNQPPHTSYYIGSEMSTPSKPAVYTCGNYQESGVSDSPSQETTKETTKETTTETTTKAQTSVSSASWNFSSSAFSGLGTITATKTVDNLKLIATSSKTMSVNSNSQSLAGTNYKYCLALGGGGNTSSRAVSFNVNGNADIKITAMSSGSSTRTLAVANSSGKEIGTVQATNSLATNTVSYKGNADTLYIYSKGSGINIFKIEVSNSGSTATTKATTTTTTKATTTTTTEATTETTTKATVNAISDGWYYIKNVNSNKYLQVEGNVNGNGQNVNQGTGTGVAGQKWYVTNTSDGYMTLQNGLGNMIDIPYGENADLVNVQIYEANNLDPQRFKAVKISSGVYGILTKCSGDTKAFDVLGFSTEDNANVMQYTYAGGTNQQWRFEETTAPSTSGGSSSEEGSSEAVKGSWSFSDSQFTALSSIKENVVIDGLTLVATSSKSMSIKGNSAGSYSHCLALGGGGSTAYRAIKLTVNSGSTITVEAMSSGSSARTLAVVDANGNQLGTITADKTLSSGSVNCNTSGDVYIYSTGSGINVYSVSVN